MKNYYKVKVSYDSTNDKGISVKVVENYIVNAVSVTDAEEKVYSYLDAVSNLVVVDVTSIKNLSGVIVDDNSVMDAKYFKAVSKIISFDERTNKEKETSYNLIIATDDYDKAYAMAKKEMSSSMLEYVFYSLTTTNFVDLVN